MSVRLHKTDEEHSEGRIEVLDFGIEKEVVVAYYPETHLVNIKVYASKIDGHSREITMSEEIEVDRWAAFRIAELISKVVDGK